MVVFVTGATGFIGRNLVEALLRAGHRVVCAVRNVEGRDPLHPEVRYIEADFTRDLDPRVWLPRLRGVDAVVNATGILRERGSQSFAAIHARAPQALFAACAAAGVRRVIQVSALGADSQACSRYHLSKKEADDFLAGLQMDWVVVQPSLVFGANGTSARLFAALASLPWIPLPGGGGQLVQPVHIDDVVQSIMTLLETQRARRGRIPLVGPRAMRLRDFLASLRVAMGLGKARFIHVPMSLVRLAAALGALVPRSLLDSETLDMLIRGNTASDESIHELLGRAPRPVESLICARDAPAVRAAAKLQWLLPLLRWSIALVWLAAAVFSAGVYPVGESYELLRRVGVAGPIAPVFLYGAALLDLVLGAATLVMRRRRPLWLAQIAVILLYTAIITVRVPEFWLHPFGPILKNLPLLVGIWMLYELEPR